MAKETPILIYQEMVWDADKGSYIAKQSPSSENQILSIDSPLPFGEVTLTLQNGPGFSDPTNPGLNLVLERQVEKLSQPMFLSWERPHQEPYVRVIGQDIMTEVPTYFLGDLNQLTRIEVFQGIPSSSSHPNKLEISPAVSIGENGRMLH